MSRTLHAGWFRCRIRGRAKSAHPWVYYHVCTLGSERELFREARYFAGLYLRRQVFDCERQAARPENLTAVKTINETVFYYQDALCEVSKDKEVQVGL